MQEFEFLRHITIGQYLPGHSLVHHLDPRTKITVLLLLTLAITLNASYLSNVILLAVSLACVLLARVSLRYILLGVKPALPLIVALAVLQLLFYGDAFVPPDAATVTFLRWGWVHITNGSVQLVIVSTMRFLELLFLTSLLTATTTTTELAHGMEDMLRPFSRLGLPGHELSLVGTIALRFVPILAMQLETIMKAQASRGANLGTGGRLQFVHTTHRMMTLIVPLFIDALRRAEDLILAMEARCYVGGRGRTHLVHLRLAPRDRRVLGLSLLFASAMVAWRNRFPF